MARWLLSLVGFLLPAAAVSSPGGSLPASAPRAPEVAPTTVAAVVRTAPAQKHGAPLRIPGARSLMIAPYGCDGLERKFDLLVHFHGAYTTVEPQLMQSGIDALYVVVNLGIGSGAYEDAFATKRSLADFIERIGARINQKCGGIERSVGRVALSGWSAGYGGIYRALARPADADRIDAVLLADGMHVGFEVPARTARAAAMEPFRAFGERARTGEKLMAVTHSAIVPPGYASTTLTASFLVEALRVESQPLTLPAPRADMEQTRRAERGSLFIDGYAGGNAHAHSTHLYAIGRTLWSRLHARWSQQ
jgi:hypothetical protein